MPAIAAPIESRAIESRAIESRAIEIAGPSASKEIAPAQQEPIGDISAALPGTPLHQYRAAFQGVDGMIRELATSCSQVEAMSDGHWRVVMENQYLAELCKRQDRRQQIEQAVEVALGRRIRIDFTFRVESEPHLATGKTPPKAQALRELQENPFVSRLNEVFSAEWVEILPPRPRKNHA
jgi:hypothetical protein